MSAPTPEQEAAFVLHRAGEPVVYSQAHFLKRLDEKTAELRGLLAEALEALRTEHENREGHVSFCLACPVCDGALPMSHSLGCRIETALALRGGSGDKP